MKKALFSVLMVLALTLALALGVSGAEVVETGNLTETVRYTLYADGKMVIEGTGELPGHFYDLGGYFYDNFPNVTRIEVGEGITSLETYCFYNLQKLQSVSLPSTLKTIGSSAFGNCSELQSVVLPEGLQFIGQGAFMNSYELTSILIPASVAEIGDTAFSGCPKLKEVVFQGLPPVMSEMAFFRDWDPGITVYYPANSGWSKEHLLYLGENTTWISYTLDSQGNRIPDESSAYAAQLLMKTSGTFSSGGYWNVDSDGVLTIGGAGAISPNSLCDTYWKNITKVVIESDVMSMYYGFRDCESLTAVVIQSPMWTYPGFNGCNALTEVSLPEGMTSFTCRLANCASLKEIKIPSGVTTIGYAAMVNTAIEHITIPSGVHTIEMEAFYDNPLRNVVIPASVQTIGDKAFFECMELETVMFLGSAPTTIGELCFSKGVGEMTLYYPAGDPSWTEDVMQKLSGAVASWIPYTLDASGNRVPDETQKKQFVGIADVKSRDGVTCTLYGDGYVRVEGSGVLGGIGGDLWENYHTIEICEGITAIEQLPYGRTEEKKLTVIMSESVKEIDENVFKWCNIESIDLSYVEKIGANAFYGCESLKSVTFGKNLKSIGYQAFFECKKLESAVLYDGLEQIESFAFRFCTNLETVVIPGTVKSILKNTFEGCENLSDVTLSEGLEKIAENAFCRTGGMELVIPSTVVSVGEGAFSESKVESLAFNDASENAEKLVIARGAFYQCKNLKTVDFGNRACHLDNDVFTRCVELQSVASENLEYIGNSVFRECTSLASIEIPASLKIVSDCAFYGCTSLAEVTLHESLEIIGEMAFRFCALKEIVIPSTVTDIGGSAFSEGKLENVTFLTNRLTRIADACFADTNIKNIEIPEGVKIIERYAFGEIFELETVILPETLESMEDMAFAYSSAIRLVIFKGSLPSMVATPFCHVGNYAIAYPNQYADSYRDGNLEYLIAGGAFVSEKISYTLGENGEMLAPKVDDSETLTNLAKARETYPEGYSLGQYSVSNLNLANVLGYGSQAFAYMLSDALYPNMPSETIWDVKFEDVQLGDILRLPGMARSAGSGRAVVVIEKNGDTVTVAQGDWRETPDAPGTVHWGEVLSRQQVEMAEYRITRHVSDLLADPGDIPTYEPEAPVMPENVTEDEMQSLLYSLKDSLPEGFPYTTDITYATQAEGMENDLSGYGQGCSAFAYWVSDMAFGTAPMRYVTDVDYDDIMVGDILHYDPDPGDDTTHVVVVLEVYQECLVTVEANYGETVHWGSVFTEDQVESMLGYYTRYPEGTTHEERAEYEGEISDKHQIDGFFQMMEEDTVVETGHTVFEALSGQELTFDYEIPENGAVMLIFFFNWCGFSESLLSELDGCAWLDNPALEIIAVETEEASSEMMADYISRVTPNSFQYIQYFTASSDLHSAYENTYVDGFISSPCIIIITDNNGTPVVSRSRAGYISTEALYGCLTSISEGFAFHEGHEHDFVFKRTVKPTCDEQGYAVYRCDCGKKEHRDFVDALGHSWVEATCAVPKTCSVCQKTEGAALKHEYQNDICIHCGEEMKGIMGDLDGNGKLSYNDALVILRGSIGLVKLDDTQKLLADVDGNGIVNYNDALLVLRKSIGLA